MDEMAQRLEAIYADIILSEVKGDLALRQAQFVELQKEDKVYGALETFLFSTSNYSSAGSIIHYCDCISSSSSVSGSNDGDTGKVFRSSSCSSSTTSSSTCCSIFVLSFQNN